MKNSCLALHGLGGGTFEFGGLLDALRTSGARVVAPTLPGHEVTSPRMPDSRWEDWAAASEAAFDELAGEGSPVAVIGFSTGGTLALRLAARRPVARLVLIAPFLAIRYSGLVPVRPTTYLRAVAWAISGLPRRPPPVRDPVMRRWASKQERFQTFNLRATLSALDLIERVKPLVPAITQPTLILQGRLDTVVEPTNASWLLDRLGSVEKRLSWFERSDHLVLLDRDREDAVLEVMTFLGKGT